MEEEDGPARKRAKLGILETAGSSEALQTSDTVNQLIGKRLKVSWLPHAYSLHGMGSLAHIHI